MPQHETVKQMEIKKDFWASITVKGFFFFFDSTEIFRDVHIRRILASNTLT